MKKTTLITLTLSFFIVGSVTQQAQAISVSPTTKRILGKVLAGYAVYSPISVLTFFQLERIEKNLNRNLTFAEDCLLYGPIFPGLIPGVITWGLTGKKPISPLVGIALTSMLFAYGSYKLHKSATEQEKEAARKKVVQ